MPWTFPDKLLNNWVETPAGVILKRPPFGVSVVTYKLFALSHAIPAAFVNPVVTPNTDNTPLVVTLYTLLVEPESAKYRFPLESNVIFKDCRPVKVAYVDTTPVGLKA